MDVAFLCSFVSLFLACFIHFFVMAWFSRYSEFGGSGRISNYIEYLLVSGVNSAPLCSFEFWVDGRLACRVAISKDGYFSGLVGLMSQSFVGE